MHLFGLQLCDGKDMVDVELLLIGTNPTRVLDKFDVGRCKPYAQRNIFALISIKVVAVIGKPIDEITR